MTEQDRQSTAEIPSLRQPEVTADEGTDRPRPPWHISHIPTHLGRARTSTVVLSVLFLAIGALYLQIRPDTDRAATSGTSTEQEAPETTPPPETTPEDEDTPDPSPTTGPTQPTAPTSPTSTPRPTEDTDEPTSPRETADEDQDAPATSAPSLPTGTGTGSAPS